MSEPGLLAAALGFAGASAFGSAVALRHDVPGEPLGFSVPLSVSRGLLVGWGAGVAAPWPMPATALVAATAGSRVRGNPGWVCVGLGIGCIAGTFVEPVTYHRRPWTPAIRAAIALNLLASAGLAAAGLRYVKRPGSRDS